MYIFRNVGSRRRWTIGGSVSLMWLLLMAILMGVVLYSAITGHNPS